MSKRRQMSNEQEKRIQKTLDHLGKSTRQPGSGCLWFAPSDNRLEGLINLRIEAKCKTEPSKSHSVKRLWYDKLREECSGNEEPIVVFDMGDEQDIYSMEEDVFIRLLNTLHESLDAKYKTDILIKYLEREYLETTTGNVEIKMLLNFLKKGI